MTSSRCPCPECSRAAERPRRDPPIVPFEVVGEPLRRLEPPRVLDRWDRIRRDVLRGVEAIDRVWPGWWAESLGVVLSTWRIRCYLAYSQGDRRIHDMEAREHGIDYFFTDECEAALVVWCGVVRGRRACAWEFGMVMLTRLWEIDL